MNHYFWNWLIYNFISPEKNINRKFYFPLIASQLLFFLPSLKALVFARQIEDFFPTFPFLTRFALEVDDSGWHLLPLIFSRMPNLESFVFEVDEVRMWWAFSWTVTQFFFCLWCLFFCNQDTDFDCWWAEEPLSLPDCLLPHVKTIEMRGFAGRKNELKLIKFLLKNCEVLNTMIIKFQKKRVQKMVLMEKLCKKLSVFRRVSKTCQIIVLWEFSI